MPLLADAAAAAEVAEAQDSLARGHYEVVARTILPNLEESLRYATTRAARCLANESATSLFPILLHPAFGGCALVRRDDASDELEFQLQCLNAQAASGKAWFWVDEKRFSGTLELKMGGKNMTLSQRIEGSRSGDCAK